ncbi:MAG: hypothetical protein QM803_11975 [Rhodocyclaceae bacterium]
MFEPDFVPVRTQTGQVLLDDQDARVAGRRRQVMRLIDGRRRLAQIAIMMPGRDLANELNELVSLGLVHSPAGPPQEHARAEALPARWADALAFMKATATASMGVMARAVIASLEQVHDAGSARSAIARWHMALRESRTGRQDADALLQTVTNMLGIH